MTRAIVTCTHCGGRKVLPGGLCPICRGQGTLVVEVATKQIRFDTNGHPGTWKVQYVMVDGQPGEWKRMVVLSCPECGRKSGLTNHVVAEDGTVTPSVMCPYEDCNFHESVQLLEWDPALVT